MAGERTSKALLRIEAAFSRIEVAQDQLAHRLKQRPAVAADPRIDQARKHVTEAMAEIDRLLSHAEAPHG